MKTRGEGVRDALAEVLPPWGVLVLESHHSPAFSMQWRTHTFAKVVYVLEGAGRFDIADDTVSFNASDVILVPPDTRNRIRDDAGNPVSLYAACISRDVLNSDPVLIDRLSVRHWTGIARHSLSVAAVLRRMVLSQEQDRPTRSIDMLIDAWRLIRLVSQSPPQPKRADSRNSNFADSPCPQQRVVEIYVEHLKQHFLQAESIDDAAAHCGLPRREFTRRFREITGSTWLEYVRTLGIEHAKSLLNQSDLPIIAVAFEAGFVELSTFYRQFAKRVGQSPASYRESCRK